VISEIVKRRGKKEKDDKTGRGGAGQTRQAREIHDFRIERLARCVANARVPLLSRISSFQFRDVWIHRNQLIFREGTPVQEATHWVHGEKRFQVACSFEMEVVIHLRDRHPKETK
jgi:hypothetical protein